MQTVIGLFENSREAQNAVQQLLTRGFSHENVDVSVRENNNSGNYTGNNNDYNSNDAGYTGDLNDVSGDNRLFRENSLENNSGSLSGTGYSNNNDENDRWRERNPEDKNDDSFGDKVSRFFTNLFGGDDDDTASRYSHVARTTGSIVTVQATSGEEAEKAADILDEYGAINVDERASEYGYNKTRGADNISSVRKDRDTDTDTNSLNVIKEDVNISKREVTTGGLRVRSRIVERPVEEKLRLREEKVTVERTAVDRPASAEDLQNFREGEIEMTEFAEVADISKQARVVEEIKLSKEVNERTEKISETARDTEVDVEKIDKNKNRDF